MNNFLKNRKISVRIKDKHSPEKQVHSGIPQGSVLSCTCFILALNQLGTDLKNVNYMIFVDDFAMVAVAKQQRTAIRQLAIALKLIEKWSQNTGFKFSSQKTATMHICRVTNCPKASPQLTLYNTELQHLTSYKYLGIIIDESLTWNQHITYTKRKAAATINVLKAVSRKDYGADRESLKRIFIALHKPTVEYGSECFSSASKTNLQKLDPTQNAALRIITGAFRTTPIDSLQAETGIRSLAKSREIKNFNYMLRLQANPDQTILNLISNVEPEKYELKPKKPKPFYIRYQKIIEKYNFNTGSIMREDLGKNPPWFMEKINCCKELSKLNKGTLSTTILKSTFLEHIQTHQIAQHYYTDGSKNNEGTAYAYHHRNFNFKIKIPNPSSIYTAELLAIKDATIRAISTNANKALILTDSLSAIDAINKIKNKHPIISQIKNIIQDSQTNITICWTPAHTGIQGNETAEKLAKEAISTENITNISLPRNDIQANFKAIIKKQWQNEWNDTNLTNKLRNIKSKIGPFNSSFHKSRAWERVLARLRLGHTKLTHEYLLKGENQPYCQDCIVPLTVKHLLIECPSFQDQRRQLTQGNNGSPTELIHILGDDGPVQNMGKLHKYLQDIDILNKI